MGGSHHSQSAGKERHWVDEEPIRKPLRWLADYRVRLRARKIMSTGRARTAMTISAQVAVRSSQGHTGTKKTRL